MVATVNRLWVLAAIAAALLAWQGYGCEQRTQGELKSRIAELERGRDELLDHMQMVDTIYQRDTVTLTKWRVRYNEVRDTVDLTDTTKVRQVLLLADVTIQSCSNALETCEQRVAIRDSLLTSNADIIDALRKRRPSRFGCAGPLAATTKGIGLGVACGLRF